MDFLALSPLLLSSAALAVEWRYAPIRSLAHKWTDRAQRSAAWVADERGAYASLAEQLQYRDFYRDGIIETTDGWFWCGMEVMAASSDGHSNADTNELSKRMNMCLANLPAGTKVQTINRIEHDATEPVQILERVAARSSDPVWRAVYRARADFIRSEASLARIRSRKTWVFIGRQTRKLRSARITLAALASPSPWIDLEVDEYRSMREEVFRVRDQFQGYFRDCGAHMRDLNYREVMQLAYRRLNPTRSRSLECPLYEHEWNENPRHLLCLTNVDVEGEILRWNNSYAATLNLHRLPVKADPRTIERVLRSTHLDFDYELATHFEVGNWIKWDNRFNKQEQAMAVSLDQSRVANRDELAKASEVAQLRDEIRQSNEKVGVFGLAATTWANTPDELRRRCDLLAMELRKAEGLETTLDRSTTLTAHLATLPATPHKDQTSKPVLSRDAAHLAGWTGGPSLPATEGATLVFQRPDHGFVYFDQTTRAHASNHALVAGPTGWGKSSLMNLLRVDHLARGRKGVVFDYRTSGRRIVAAAGGLHIDIADANSAKGLGVFDIRPKLWERFAATALTPEGLPNDRLIDVVRILEKLCLDPLRVDEVSLDPVKRLYLEHAVRRTYHNKLGGVPTLDDFIRTAKNSLAAERETASDIAARLALYASVSSFGRFLNDESEAPDFRNVPLIYFDFRHAKADPRRLLLSTLIAQAVLDRYLFGAPSSAGTFLHMDEVGVMARSPLLADIADDVARTARKYNGHCTFGSQHPEDFEQPRLRALALNCEVKYLFRMPKSLSKRLFDVPEGVANLVAQLERGGDEFRDCALVSPTLVAHLRLRYGAVDGRLLMEASTGVEKYTATDALKGLPADAPERLIDALRLNPRDVQKTEEAMAAD